MAYFEKFPIPSKNCKNPSSWPNIAPPIVNHYDYAKRKNSSSKARYSCLNRKIISLEPLFALKNTKPHRRTDLPYICSLQTLFPKKNEKKKHFGHCYHKNYSEFCINDV